MLALKIEIAASADGEGVCGDSTIKFMGRLAMPPVFSDPTLPVAEEGVFTGGATGFSSGGFDAIFQLSLPLLQRFSDAAFRSAGLDTLAARMRYELQNLPLSVRGAVGRALQSHPHTGPPYSVNDPIAFEVLVHRPQLQTLLAPNSDTTEAELGGNARVIWDVLVVLIVKKKPQMIIEEQIFLTRGTVATVARVPRAGRRSTIRDKGRVRILTHSVGAGIRTRRAPRNWIGPQRIHGTGTTFWPV
jgi:hypothetical protein